ncbi:DUF4476 domain-containing protein [Flavobacterium selenitireducens]|uniref:DUF4476 domain-containing protein n=1 Tax=Flavobacterium selenitireducens TaxID=2722704 RepID=UPI00168C0DCB|nr:DUF4476 domain-containing protein [Flavobacterium selenitireducens]MBD3581867.1 DUF4476 domain-containing protein [Flavobacterium selenitireducens]
MKLSFTSLLFLLLSFIGNAQNYGHLTIFSEDGDKFFLILNGEKINDVAQTNLRVEDLPQPYYSAKIIFEDKSKKEITTNNLALTDVDDHFMDVTYKIRRDKKSPSKMKMNFFSMAEIEPDFTPPPSLYVMHYGQPQPRVTQTVTTTTTNAQPAGGVSMGMSAPGMNVNISIQEPQMTETISHTTTTTMSVPEEDRRRPRGCRDGYAMSPRQLDDMLSSLRKQTFEDTRLKTAKQMVSNNCMSAAQVAKMCLEFKFEDNRLNLAKHAFPFCTDPNNYYKVNDVFTYSSSTDELTEFVANR